MFHAFTLYTYDNQQYVLNYEDINNGNCKAFDYSLSGIIPRPAAVVCNGTLRDNYTGAAYGEVSQYTIVHELGHIFDYRSGTLIPGGVQGGISLALGLNTFYRLVDCSAALTMGEQQGTTWTRGERGWGSGPAASARDINGTPTIPLITNFQQNPLFYTGAIDDGKNSEEILEAAADMLLNWVYRANASAASSTPVEPCPIPLPTSQHWTGPGFLNNNWAAQTAPVGPNPGTAGIPDDRLRGDARYFEMQSIINALFAQHPGW